MILQTIILYNLMMWQFVIDFHIDLPQTPFYYLS